jgi:hypothetical protein
MGQIAQ